MQLDFDTCAARSFRDADTQELARHANNRQVWLQLRDRFPYPFAVTVGDAPVGAIGVMLRDDVERCSAEVGYWLGEPYWGRGIATSALVGFTRFAFVAYELERLYAVPFASNGASCRVLENAGYVLEGRMRRSAIKDGVLQDQLLYAVLRGDEPSTTRSCSLLDQFQTGLAPRTPRDRFAGTPRAPRPGM
jgi:RimJ/RimL family protein N-acetyltransferase